MKPSSSTSGQPCGERLGEALAPQSSQYSTKPAAGLALGYSPPRHPESPWGSDGGSVRPRSGEGRQDAGMGGCRVVGIQDIGIGGCGDPGSRDVGMWGYRDVGIQDLGIQGWGIWASENTGCRNGGSRDVGIQDRGIQGCWQGCRIQGYGDAGIPGSRDVGIQNLGDLSMQGCGIQGNGDLGTQGCRTQGCRDSGPKDVRIQNPGIRGSRIQGFRAGGG